MFSLFGFKHFSPQKSKYKYKTPNTIAVSLKLLSYEKFSTSKT